MPEVTDIALLGGRLCVQRGGRGEPLLFLHGAQGLDGWQPALAALAESFEVVAPDHPGYGRSTVIDGIDDMADLALFYLDVLDVLGYPKLHVVGQCVGGWLALEIAVRNAAKIKSLTLAASAGLRLPGIPRADMFIPPQEELAQLSVHRQGRRRGLGHVLARLAGARGHL